MKYPFILLALLSIAFVSCDKDNNDDDKDEPMVHFRFNFDENQIRLNNLGEPAIMPVGNAGQSPQNFEMAAHYIELSQDKFTQVGGGAVLYKSDETTAGGTNAITFDNLTIVGDGQEFFFIPLKDIAEGTYEHLRVSLAYQNYDIDMTYNNSTELTGTVASFVGFNTYINSVQVDEKSLDVNDNRLQGFWAFELKNPPFGINVPILSGQAPATTVVNPLFATSPIPAGSCLVTAQFPTAFTISHSETADQFVDVSLSVNNSFEWKDTNGNGKWDVGDTANDIEQVVDMGVRGMQVAVAVQ